MKDQKTWFITGCDKGMGYAFAETILAFGDRVVVTARDKSNVAALAEKYPQTALTYTLDITNHADIKRVVDDAEKVTGGIDVLVNNAGYGMLGPVEAVTPEEYRPLFEVNFFGAAEVMRAVVPYMRQRRRGFVICTTSSGGFAASPGFSFYAASKFALEGLTEALAAETAALGIKVMILEPGSTRTDFAGGSMAYAKVKIADYEQTAVTSTMDRMKARHGTQPGDPRRLAKVLIKLSRMEKVPLRLPAGDDSIDRMRLKLATTAADADRFEELCRAIAFDSKVDLD